MVVVVVADEVLEFMCAPVVLDDRFVELLLLVVGLEMLLLLLDVGVVDEVEMVVELSWSEKYELVKPASAIIQDPWVSWENLKPTCE